MYQETAAHPRAGSQWTRLGISIGLALVANFIIYLVGNALLDRSIQVADPSTDAVQALPPFALVAASIVAVALGVAFLSIAERWWRLTPALVMVGIVTLLSLGAVFALNVTIGSKLALTLMHLSTGSAVIGTALWARE